MISSVFLVVFNKLNKNRWGKSIKKRKCVVSIGIYSSFRYHMVCSTQDLYLNKNGNRRSISIEMIITTCNETGAQTSEFCQNPKRKEIRSQPHQIKLNST